MSNIAYKTRIQHKIDTTANWALATNFIPLKGELIIYSDGNGATPKVKIGDGITIVTELPFVTSETVTDEYLPLSGGTVTGTLISQGLFRVTNTTASSSTSTGAAVISGGLGVGGNIYGDQVFGAVWNDYAEFRKTIASAKPGQVVIENGDGTLRLSSERLQPGCEVISDTYGFAIGETEDYKTPIAVSGRVLAYTYENRDTFVAGEPVCSGPNGTVSRMTREEVKEYPERIIGTVSEIPNYEVWGTGNISVDGRIWIRIR